MTVRILTTGQVGSVVKGPYKRYGQEWYDVVTCNDFGEPGAYSRAYQTRHCIIIED